MQRQDSMQFQARNPQIQALIQQQRLRQQHQQQQQILQSMPQLQRAHMQQQQQQQQQQMQLRQQLQQQALQPASSIKRPYDGGVCARRLMQYLYHQRQRPADNSIAYWRKFVTEYYSPRAKKRWCLSLYDNVGHHALGVFPQASMDAWQCDICGSKSGRGFEATFEVLPRLNEIKFGSGVIDELLFLDFAKRIYCLGNFVLGAMKKLLPRRLVAPQVNQLVQDLQTNSNLVLNAGRQLAKSLELQSLNDLGFSKRYVRVFAVADLSPFNRSQRFVNSMKDLIDFCRENKDATLLLFLGFKGFEGYPRHATAAKLQMQKMQEMEQIS
ncbi:hypothetical protein M0R45_037994 [Rubus argutus]|uniref:Uncharacterized protein n=1 Tax=Rubus argutus TaxID=59490 RepID=A0AAW1W165_RUBAR